MPQRTCNSKWNTVLPNNIVCVTKFDDSGAVCQGDSGGPLVVKFQKTFIQVAVVSSGDNFCNVDANPTIFTLIDDESLQWINIITQK